MTVDWEPDRYERFKAQRAEPFWDLMELVHRGGIERAVDLGCGTKRTDRGRRRPAPACVG
ncbi:MAG: hypothetical protein R2697_21690 [Ilumatobacteraceae bacterium]